MARTRTAITLVVVLIGALFGSTVAVAQAPPPPPPIEPTPVDATIDAEPEEQTHVVTTGAEIVATVRSVTGEPLPNRQVFWTEEGVGEIVEAETQTDENGEARAITTSRTPGDQFVTAWLDQPSQTPCPDADTGGRCDRVVVHWVARQTANQPALECSGGALALGTPLGNFGEIPYEEVPCPEQGSTDPDNPDPTVVEEELLDLGFAEVVGARREFGSDYAMASSRVAGVELGGLVIEVASAFARSECSPNGVATQEQGVGLIIIKTDSGTPDDPSDDEEIFNGTPSPNTEIPLGFGTLILNEQNPEGGTVGPELPGEVQNRHAEGEVTAVHLTGPIEIVAGNARSDVTCKQHTFAIDVEPEEQTAEVGSQATVTATVRDEAGRPVQGEEVTWTETGPGEFTSTENTTDENGEAQATVTSNEEGDQEITATLSSETTKCEVAEGGICSDTVVVHWRRAVQPAAHLAFHGHAHTDYDGDNRAHVRKNDYGDVHIGGHVVDNNLADNRPGTGRLGYWDLRRNPPGPMTRPFRCEHFTIESMRLLPGPAKVVQFQGEVGRCNKAQRDPTFRRYRMTVRDNGPNPPNQDGYHVIFFDRNGRVVYDWQDRTTVGLGDLCVFSGPGTAPPASECRSWPTR